MTLLESQVWIREEEVPQTPWRAREWRCKIGLHRYDPLTQDDIEAASQVCA